MAGTLAGTLELAHTLSKEANNLRFWPVHIITTNVAGEAQATGSRRQDNKEQVEKKERGETQDKAAVSACAAS